MAFGRCAPGVVHATDSHTCSAATLLRPGGRGGGAGPGPVQAWEGPRRSAIGTHSEVGPRGALCLLEPLRARVPAAGGRCVQELARQAQSAVLPLSLDASSIHVWEGLPSPPGAAGWDVGRPLSLWGPDRGRDRDRPRGTERPGLRFCPPASGARSPSSRLVPFRCQRAQPPDRAWSFPGYS